MKSFELVASLACVFAVGFVTGSYRNYLAHVLCRDCLRKLPLHEEN